MQGMHWSNRGPKLHPNIKGEVLLARSYERWAGRASKSSRGFRAKFSRIGRDLDKRDVEKAVREALEPTDATHDEMQHHLDYFCWGHSNEDLVA